MTIGIVDSGIDPSSAEFTGRILAASADTAGSRGMGDSDGHGTNVAQIAAGGKNNDTSGTHGVAFNASLLIARTDTPESCATATGCDHADPAIARGIDLAVANNAKVINISLGGSPANAQLRASIDRATAAGVIIVFSAGNDSDANPDPFAQIASEAAVARGLIIIAGAVDSSHQLASFSNLAGNGAAQYLAALGNRVCCIYENGAIKRDGTSVFVGNGTSFSAPVITGAVALLRQAFPNLTPRQIVDLLFNTADDLGAAGTDTTFGHGELNIERAFAPQGQLSLAGSQTPVAIGEATGTTAAPMGDGAKSGLAMVMLDSYGRAFAIELPSAVRSAPLPKLGAALGIGTQSMNVANGIATISLAIRDPQTDAPVERQLLSIHDERRARALAGSVITRIGPSTAMALGISRSGLSLASELTGRGSGDFLLGPAAIDGFGFDARARSGFAMQHRLGPVALTASAESGNAQLWESAFAALRRGYRDHRYDALSLGASGALGRLAFSARATNLIERETVLGSRFGALFGSQGARSWFADFEARWAPADDWTLVLSRREGWTRLAAGGLRQGADRLRTNAWSFDVSKRALFGPADRFSIRASQPLRVSKGGFGLTVPVSYDYEDGSAQFSTTRFNLAPTGRERDLEAAYSMPLWGGQVSANAFWRHEASNLAEAPEDLGAAIRFSLGL